MWQTDQKLIDAQCKLTAANLELQRLRTAGEQHAQEMSYVRRLLEREQRERASADAELHALRQASRKDGAIRADAGPSDAVQSERVLLLKAQLDESQERSRTFASESDRLRDEVAQLRRALGERGESGELRSELSHLRDERVRLALELHDSKQVAANARAEAAHATEQVKVVDSLREAHRQARRR